MSKTVTITEIIAQIETLIESTKLYGDMLRYDHLDDSELILGNLYQDLVEELARLNDAIKREDSE